MGVPKFYRWISQRYPCINQLVRENEIVPVDHLYLDMNGIIHTCSHCENVAFKAYDEEAVFKSVENYIIHIFNLMKPRKTFFLAVDGVAPRAKMTQQRARRFDGPKQAAAELKKRKAKGEELDEDAIFDSNVISPGTEFMARLHDFFKSFIARQVATDRYWKSVDIVYSGHDCPGEGEQKIREYMSYQRSLPDYRPVDRHCLYGMDADLIFLGLATHEPNMCILRENVFTVKSPRPCDIPFCLVHMSLLREYIEMEFKCLEPLLKFPYHIDRIIDDWILLAYLLGNDFIPHLPNMHIHAESLTILWDSYQVVLPKLDGYLHDFGKLNINRLHVYLSELAEFDLGWFEEREADQRWMKGKHGERMALELENMGTSRESKLRSVENVSNLQNTDRAVNITSDSADSDLAAFFCDSGNSMFEAPSKENPASIPLPNKEESPHSFDLNNYFGGLVINEFDELMSESEHSGNNDMNTNNDEIMPELQLDVCDEEIDDDLIVYRMHRQDYYSTKLNLDIRGEKISSGNLLGEDPDQLERSLLPICRSYMQTLQWILDYYFTSVVDWSFYYPFHYAPFASDLLLFTKRFIVGGPDYLHGFDRSWANFSQNTKPLLPFQQQMFIMPPASSKILPEPYRWLLTSKSSPVAEFYPEDFQTDINGKLASWEAVVLIPFIDETKLLFEMEKCTSKLSESDSARNIHRGHLIIKANTNRQLIVDTSFDSLLADEVDGEFYRKNVLRNLEACCHVYTTVSRSIDPDYPSFSRLPFTYKLDRIGVQTFSFPSKLESVVLTVQHPLGRLSQQWDSSSDNSLKPLAEQFLGTPITVGWPYVRHVLPIGILDENEIWEIDIGESLGVDSVKLRDSTHLREKISVHSTAPAPFWTSLSWLSSQSGWIKNRLKDRCAIVLADQPRAALICRSFKAATFIVAPSYDASLRLQPVFTESDLPRKLKQEPPLIHGKARDSARVNKPCLNADANISVAIDAGVSLELLDLSFLTNSSLSSSKVLSDLFCIGDRIVIFNSTHFGRLAQITALNVINEITVNVEENIPLVSNPVLILEATRKADESSYMSIKELAQMVQLDYQAVLRLADEVMVRAPTSENVKFRNRGVLNIGLGLRMNRSLSCVVGWSRFSNDRNMWLYSSRVCDVIKKYSSFFPEIINYLSGWNNVGLADVAHIFPDKTQERFRQLTAFLRTEVWSRKMVSTSDSQWLDTKGISMLDSLLPVADENKFEGLSSEDSSNEKLTILASEAFLLLPEGGRLVPNGYLHWIKSINKKLGEFSILDRVMYVGSCAEMFGLTGIIIGRYSLNNQPRIEVIFDKSFHGAISIRNSTVRCAVVNNSQLLHFPTRREATSSSTKKKSSSAKIFRSPSPNRLRELHPYLPPEWIQADPEASSMIPPASSNPWSGQNRRARKLEARLSKTKPCSPAAPLLDFHPPLFNTSASPVQLGSSPPMPMNQPQAVPYFAALPQAPPFMPPISWQHGHSVSGSHFHPGYQPVPNLTPEQIAFIDPRTLFEALRIIEMQQGGVPLSMQQNQQLPVFGFDHPPPRSFSQFSRPVYENSQFQFPVEYTLSHGLQPRPIASDPRFIPTQVARASTHPKQFQFPQPPPLP